MGLTTIGGSGSGGGNSGGGNSGGGTTMLVKDVGESMLVPLPFQHDEFTDTGAEITNSKFPQLYQRLNSGSKPVNYSETGDVGSALAEVRAIGKAAVLAIESGNELIVIHANGIVTASTDGLNYVYRGQMPSLYGITPDLFWPAVTTGNIAVKGTRILATSTTRGFCAAWYSDDQGATWTLIQDSVLSDTIMLSTPYRQRPLSATSTHFWYAEASGARRLIRSADGITWEYVTNIPAFTGSIGATYADPATGTVLAFINTQNLILNSQDNGETWTLSSSGGATTAPTGNFVKFGNDIYFATYVSSNQLFYKSVDGGKTWAASGTATAVGGAGMGNLGVAGGKICCIGTSTFATNSKHITSTNGSAWTLITSPAQTNGRFPVFFKNIIVFLRDHAVAGAEKPTISTDAVNVSGAVGTSDIVMPAAMNGAVVVVTPTRMLAFSSQTTDQYAYTEDGTTWLSATMPVSAIWFGGCYDAVTGKIYMTNTTSTSYFESTDLGETWTEVAVVIPTCSAAGTVPMICGGLIAFPHAVLASRYAFLLSIPDAQGKRTQIRGAGSWTGTSALMNKTIPYRDGFLTASASTNSLNYVQDALRNVSAVRATGVATTGATLGSNATICFVASAGSLAYSTQNDLVTWTVKTLPLAQTWTKAINLNDNQFLLIAAGSFKALLGDGISWEVVDMDGIQFDDFSNAVIFKNNVYIFSTDKVTKAARSLPSSRRYIPRVTSPVEGFKYVVRAKA